MEKKFFFRWISLAAVGLLVWFCAPKQNEEALLSDARDIHFRVLTVDTHSDTPSRLL